jgi:prepilin-type N-terminal cleavage/methylation domain-containing protein
MKIKGFTLIELLIVIALIGILSTIASFSWQRYVANSSLRTGARKVAADFALYKAKAIAETRPYTITIHLSPNNNYDISAPAVWAPPPPLAPIQLVLPAFALNGVTPVDASQAQDAQITAVSGFAGGSIIIATQRGLVGNLAAPPNDLGTITLTNTRGSTAIVEIDSRGRVDVKPNML